MDIDFFYDFEWLRTWTIPDRNGIIYPHVGDDVIINNTRYFVVGVTWNDTTNPFRVKIDLEKI